MYLCHSKTKEHKTVRYFIKLAYNGTAYNGWQYQPNAPSVQETINKALTVLLRTEINIMGAGRTDTGVHARMMYAHFDYNETFDSNKLVFKLNSFLPKDITIYSVFAVKDDAHCRFDAQKRTYQYHIDQYKNAFGQDLSWYLSQKLDVPLMNEAAKILLKYTDFQCFSKVNTDVNTFDCRIFEAYWVEQNNQLIFTISANRFLRNMVRAIVGTLVNVGLHKITLDHFEQIIKDKNRAKAGFSVPAHGLYLTYIEYPYLNLTQQFIT